MNFEKAADAFCSFRNILTLLIMLIAISGAAAFGKDSSTGSPSPPPDVLILNSYHDGYTWSDREITGITETFEKSGIKADFHVEFMDSKYFPANEHFDELKALFAAKYSKRRPALLITLDNPAFEFAIKYRQKLFSGIPIVFAGLNDYEPGMLKGETGITGIVEKQDIIGTVKLAQALQPDLKEVVIIHDFTSSGLASRNEAEEQLLSLSPSIKFRYLPEMTIDEVSSTLKELKPGTVVLPFSYSRDKAGNIFTHSQLTEILVKSSAVPVYGTKEERLGHGIIGGSLLEGKSHGALGAELAVKILRGENPDSIPVVTEPRSQPMFDYQLLKKFRINQDSLPSGSEIINRPPGFYRQHAVVINVSTAIILMLAVSLVFVILSDRRRIRAEEALVQSERAKSKIIEAASREMEYFCYAVSNDLQAPLRHIHSFSSIIEEEYGSRLDDKGIRYLERLKFASKKMGELITEILALSQISKTEIHRIKFDLGKLAVEIFDRFQKHESSRSIEMTVDKGISVYADKKLVRDMLEKLLDNACKYTSKTPQAMIHLGAQGENGQVIYYIRDNGAGFDMQYAEKLFTPFQRLHADSEFEGNGVGLATVQRIINRHGGQIWADAAPGEGATFSFTLQP